MRKIVLWKAVAGVLTLLAVAGCATLSNKGPVTEKAAVKKVMEQWKHGVETKNIDEVMATVSAESFASSDFKCNTDLLIGINNSFADGSLDNAKVNLDKAQFTVEDEKATVFPVESKSKTDVATFSFQLRREDGKWLIVNLEQTSTK